jgi:hypothetical protein
MSRNRMFLGIVLIGVIGIVIAFSFLSLKPKNENVNLLPFSAESTRVDGVKALYLLYEKRGLEVDKWERRYQDLPQTTDVTLMIIGPQTSAPAGQEWEALRKWVERGNQVVLWAPLFSDWSKLFQFEVKTCDPLYISQRKVKSHEENPWFEQMNALFEFNGCLKLTDQIAPVLTDEHGNLLVAKKRVGKGAVYYVPDPYMISNSSIDLNDNIALPLGLVKKEKVWFDQSVHTIENNFDGLVLEDESQSKSFFSLVAEDGLLLIFQLLIICMLWLYARGKRFASPRFEMVKEERNALEYVDAVARWYANSSVRRDALTTQFQMLRQEMREAFRLPESQYSYEGEIKEQIKRYLDASFLSKYDELVQMMHKVETKKRISAKDFINVSKAIDSLRKEINQWRTSISQKPFRK